MAKYFTTLRFITTPALTDAAFMVSVENQLKDALEKYGKVDFSTFEMIGPHFVEGNPSAEIAGEMPYWEFAGLAEVEPS